jgi:acyl-[acyl-carrier-protein]-phospholipid O-acyltransferase/long-chain-fatty-acid--[acyl-carrier-protein] ligase
MTGYLFADKPGVLVPPAGGWHDTGDIVTIEDGFLSIAGRAKRFAKIGGEMISLAAIERMCADLWPVADHVIVNLPDPKKGEALILVTTEQRASREALLAFAKMQGMAELSVPRSILIVDAIPILGTGKVDFRATQALAKSRLA